MAATNPFAAVFAPAFGAAAVTSAWISLPAIPSRTVTIAGLTAGTAYDIQVLAIDAVGAGPPSPILTLTTKA